MSKLLHAESIKNLCNMNENFLVELLETEKNSRDVEESEPEVNCEELFEEVDFMEPTPCENDVYEVVKVAPIAVEIQPQDDFNWDTYQRLNEESKAKRRHPNQKEMICSYCFKEFATRAKRMSHEKSTHQPKNADKPLTCDRCGVK